MSESRTRHGSGHPRPATRRPDWGPVRGAREAGPGTAPAHARLGTSDCERLRDGPVAQPVNTATSAAYIAAGAAVVARADAGRAGAEDAAHPAGLVAYGSILALVGLGSIAYHGPQPRGAELMHDAPIVVLGGLIPVTAGIRLLRGRPPLPGWSVARGVALAGLAATAGAAYAAGRTEARTCNPESRWQWHGMWHVLSASAFAVVGDLLFRPVRGDA